ncbi:hypothetical protein [Sphingomonas sp. ID0503]|uniref:hypothetical protein n=1 Tax=Sphingomonas sp. ID0503 TaxID=3399691 RepID=UPI003AFADC3E
MNDAGFSPIGIVIALLALSVILLLLGFRLRRRGALASRGAALGWAVLTILPVFGAAALFFGKHQVERATGEEQAGTYSSTPDNSAAPIAD